MSILYSPVPTRGSNTSGIYPFYPTTSVTVAEEYALFDFNEIVSALGGSMGLFLGFSFLGFYQGVAGRFFPCC